MFSNLAPNTELRSFQAILDVFFFFPSKDFTQQPDPTSPTAAASAGGFFQRRCQVLKHNHDVTVNVCKRCGAKGSRSFFGLLAWNEMLSSNVQISRRSRASIHSLQMSRRISQLQERQLSGDVCVREGQERRTAELLCSAKEQQAAFVGQILVIVG